jgi:hypothetical protein
MSGAPAGGKFSALLLEGLDHYRKGKMLEAVRAWEEAYLLEPSNLRAREFLRSALERIHAHMGGTGPAPEAAQLAGLASAQPLSFGQTAIPQSAAASKVAGGPHPWLPPTRPNPPPRVKVPASPWDDGPSLAIPQEPEAHSEESPGAWGIHANAAAASPSEDDGEVAVWLRGAHELTALNDFSGALDLAAKILQHEPGNAEAEDIHRLCEENLTQMFESKLGSMARKPRVAIKPDEIIWLNLDPRAGFVLAQIDGEVSFEDLYAICGLSRLDTARILAQLLEEGVVQAQDALATGAVR